MHRPADAADVEMGNPPRRTEAGLIPETPLPKQEASHQCVGED